MKLYMRALLGGLMCAAISYVFAMQLACFGAAAFCGMGGSIIALIAAPVSLVLGGFTIFVTSLIRIAHGKTNVESGHESIEWVWIVVIVFVIATLSVILTNNWLN